MIGDDKWSMMKTVAVRIERWLTTARQGYVPLTESSEDICKYEKPVRNRRAVALSYPGIKPPGTFTLETLPSVGDNTRGRRARIRQTLARDLDENGNKPANSKPSDIAAEIKKSKHLSKLQHKNNLPRNLPKNNNTLSTGNNKCNSTSNLTATPKRSWATGGRRAVLKQELTPAGELYSYTTPHRCYICGKTCYLPFTYQPFIRVNNNYIEVTQYYCDENGNDNNKELSSSTRYHQSLPHSDTPLVVLAFDSTIKSSKI